MNLSKIERETIILFNEEEKTATIDTCNAALMRRMDQYSAADPDCRKVKMDEYGAKYVCPKSWGKGSPAPTILGETKARDGRESTEELCRWTSFSICRCDIPGTGCHVSERICCLPYSSYPVNTLIRYETSPFLLIRLVIFAICNAPFRMRNTEHIRIIT